MKEKSKKGKLYLVSAGIGDLENMTLRAHKIVTNADIVLAMEFVRKQYEQILVGKEVHDAGHGLFTNIEKGSGAYGDKDKIRSVVRGGVLEGKIVVVLDFGDPVLYGPQSGYLKEFADLNPEVVPGLSSFNAASAALGREITGGYDRAVVISEAMNSQEGDDRLEKLAATGSTLVLLTMRMDIDKVVFQLKKHLPEDTPAAVVCSAGFKDKERVLKTTLGSLAKCIRLEEPSWDYILYIGDFL